MPDHDRIFGPPRQSSWRLTSPHPPFRGTFSLDGESGRSPDEGLNNGEGRNGTPGATFSGPLDLRVRQLHNEPHVDNMLPGVVEDGDDPAIGRRGDEIGMPNLKGLAFHGTDHKGNKWLLIHRFSDLARVPGSVHGQKLSKLSLELDGEKGTPCHGSAGRQQDGCLEIRGHVNVKTAASERDANP